MPFLILAAIGVLVYMSKASGLTLKDTLPEAQGGNFATDYDADFLEASHDWRVPFALLKAHAIAESSLDHSAHRSEPAHGSRPASASYGLMQILWWPGSSRFESYGYTDDFIGDGSILYTPHINTQIGAQIIKDNLRSVSGNIRDAINMYNTGVKESVREAPSGYVDKVLKYYNQLIGA